jgi:hypothetical protein
VTSHSQEARRAEVRVMKIEGCSDDQIAALVEIWKLGSPIDVQNFLARADIPSEAKNQVRMAGDLDGGSISDTEAARLYRMRQAQIVIEVPKLNKDHW